MGRNETRSSPVERHRPQASRWKIFVKLIFAIPHTIYHLFNLGPYSTGNAIANVITLGWTVVGGLIVLALLRDQEPARAPAP